MRTLISVSVLLTVCAACIYLLLATDEFAETITVSDRAVANQFDSLAAALKTTREVRVLQQPKAGGPSSAKPVLRFKSYGSLDSSCRDMTLHKLREKTIALEKKIMGFRETYERTGKIDLEKESNALIVLETRRAQIEALINEDYITVDPGTSAAMWPGNPEGMTVVTSSPRVSKGRKVEVVWFLNHGDHPSLGSQHDYAKGVLETLAGEEIMAFNSLGTPKRERLFVAIGKLGKNNLTADENADREEVNRILRHALVAGIKKNRQSCTVSPAWQ